MGRNKVLGRVQRPERKEHVRVGSQAGVMVVTEEMEARGDREAGRKEEQEERKGKSPSSLDNFPEKIALSLSFSAHLFNG